MKEKGMERNGKSLDPALIRDEIFKTPQEELRDEVNIPFDRQQNCGLLGCIFVRPLGGKMALDFYIKTDLTSGQVEER